MGRLFYGPSGSGRIDGGETMPKLTKVVEREFGRMLAAVQAVTGYSERAVLELIVEYARLRGVEIRKKSNKTDN